VVISEELWRDRLDGDPTVVGQHLTLDSTDYTIVGVMGRAFNFPHGGHPPQVWMPITQSQPFQPLLTVRLAPFLTVVGRLDAGRTMADAQAEMEIIGQRLARAFPSKPVRIVVPYPAGGSVDIVTRAVTQRLAALWGEAIVIENKAGGGTQIGAEAVAKSAADGTTLFATGMETFAITPFMVARLSFDPDKDFTPVSGLGFSNQFLVMTASSPLMTVGDVIAAAKAKPGEL